MSKKADTSPLAPISQNQALPQHLGFMNKILQKSIPNRSFPGTPLSEGGHRIMSNDRPLRIIEIFRRRAAGQKDVPARNLFETLNFQQGRPEGNSFSKIVRGFLEEVFWMTSISANSEMRALNFGQL